MVVEVAQGECGEGGGQIGQWKVVVGAKDEVYEGWKRM